MATDPLLGLTLMPGNILKNEDVYNGNLIKQNALVRGYAISGSVLDPSSLSPAPTNGDVYIVPDGSPAPSGAWAGRENAIAVYYNGWRFQTALAGMEMWVADASARHIFDGSVWSPVNGENLAGLTDVDFTGSPAPANGDTMVYDDTVSPPVWRHGAGGGGGGAWTFQETVTLTSQVNFDIPLTTANAVLYKIVFRLESDAAGDGDNLIVRVTDDGFATVESGASDYEWNDARSNLTNFTSSGNANDSSITMTTNLGTAAGEGIQGVLEVNFPHDASAFTGIESKNSRQNSASAFNSAFGSGVYKQTSDIDGIRITVTPTTGTPTLTGVAHVFALVAA